MVREQGSATPDLFASGHGKRPSFEVVFLIRENEKNIESRGWSLGHSRDCAVASCFRGPRRCGSASRMTHPRQGDGRTGQLQKVSSRSAFFGRVRAWEWLSGSIVGRSRFFRQSSLLEREALTRFLSFVAERLARTCVRRIGAIRSHVLAQNGVSPGFLVTPPILFGREFLFRSMFAKSAIETQFCAETRETSFPILSPIEKLFADPGR